MTKPTAPYDKTGAFDMKIDVVGAQRRMYAITKSQEIIRELRGKTVWSEDEIAYWLPAKLEAILHEYNSGVERIAAHYQKIAEDAVALKPPPTIIVERGGEL